MSANISDLEYKFQVRKGIIYICGNGQTMVKGAEEVLIDVIGKNKTFKDFIDEGRYKKEVWTGALV